MNRIRATGGMAGWTVNRQEGRELARKRMAGKSRAAELMPYIFLCMLTVFCCRYVVGRQAVFGAKVDWLSQHSVIPDYFRKQFYETGKLFPEFAGSLGGGQNIYNFSYYGLYSPVFLLSYLFPFVKMGDYLMAASAAGVFASVSLLYYWLGRKGFTWEIRLSASIMFLLAGPVIFHSCHQVMFVNYMPFLVMAFVGVDRYFVSGRSELYILSVFLMILTSFYFSIGGMLVLVLYGLSQYIEIKRRPAGSSFRRGEERIRRIRKHKRWRRITDFLKDSVLFLLPMLTAVLMSGFLLAPTACAIFGKREGGQGMSIKELLAPRLPLESLVHGAYGIGLTVGIITVLITGLFYRKLSERLLHGGCLIILIVPAFQWLLNGGLYVRGKALVPFLPLLCYLTAVYLEKQKEREISLGINAAAFFLTILWLCVSHIYGREFSGEPLQWYLILAESILFFICFCIYWQRGNFLLLTVPPILCLFLAGSFFFHDAGGTLDEKTYEQVTDTGIGELVDRTLAEEDGFWRIEQSGDEEKKSANLNRIWNSRQWISSLYSSAYNTEYQNFRKDVFAVEEPFRNDMMQAASDNPLYQKLMGIKYLIGTVEDEERMAAAGYERYLTDGENTVYKSGNTAPIAYATNKVIGEQEYDSLEFPCNQTALMKYAVAAGSRSQEPSWTSELKAETVPVKLSIPEIDKEGLRIARTEEGSYHIQAEKKESVRCRIDAAGTGLEDGKENGSLLFLRFRMKNHRKNKDAEVWLNGVRNKLSAENHIYYNGNTVFTYTVSLETGVREIRFDFGKGDYDLLDMECLRGDSSLLTDAEEDNKKLYQSPFKVDWENTKDNRIQGKIQVQDTGYFITSIPYEDGFEIFVDGKRTAAEKVNKAFLGCSIRKGRHQVEILYHAPGLTAGKVLACIGLLFFVLALAWERMEAPLW